jgi:hypothetical protein
MSAKEVERHGGKSGIGSTLTAGGQIGVRRSLRYLPKPSSLGARRRREEGRGRGRWDGMARERKKKAERRR